MSATRSFEAVSLASLRSDAPSCILRIVTYNILADKFATFGFASSPPPSYHTWQHREPRVLLELSSYRADVLCLQEVERPFMEGALGEALTTQGYEWKYYGRIRKPSDPVRGPEEGICLAFNASRFERVGPWEARRLGDGIDEIAPPGPFRDFVADREDGCVMTLLRDKEAHRLMKGRDGTFVASCTHLFWNPRYPEVKAAQAHLLCVALRSYLQRHNVPGLLGSPAVVLAGDFNSLPSKIQSDEYDHVPEGKSLVSGAYTCLVRGKVPRSHCDHPAHRRPREAAALRGLQLHDAGLGFVSAAVEAWGAEPPFTNRTTTFSGCLDYVFYTPEHFGAVAALELPFAWVREKGAGDRGCSKHRNMVSAEEFTPIPDESWPSDHLAMGFDLRWRSE